MKRSDLLTSLEAMADAMPSPDDDARAFLADNPLNDAEAAKAEQEGLTHLAFRQRDFRGMLEDLIDDQRVDLDKAKADIAKAKSMNDGVAKGNKTNRGKLKEDCGYDRDELPEKMIEEILGGETFESAGEKLIGGKRGRTFFRGDLGKKKIMAEVNKRRKNIV